MKNKALTVIACLFLYISSAYAQEFQLDIDNEGKIKYISADLEKKLGLFTEYSGFIEARLYKISDTEYSLEILYKVNGQTARERTSLNENGLKEFRDKVDRRLAETATVMSLDQEGRYSLLIFTTIYSLALYGPFINTIFDINNAKNIVAIECIMGSTGFFLPFWLTMDRRVTEASSFSYFYGTGIGAAQGLFIGFMIYGDKIDSESSQHITPSLALGLSLFEGISGFFISNKLKLTTGLVDNTATGSLWGTIWALETMYITTDLDNGRATGTALLAGSLGGGALAYYMSTVENYSRGDVIVQNLAAVLGAYVPLSVVESASAEDNKIFIGASLGGSIAGTVAGYFLIRGKNFSTGQGGLIALGTAAGGLLGAGTAYYFSQGNDTMYYSLSSIGAVASFSILYYLFRDKVIISDNDPSFNIQFMPIGLIGMLQKPERNTVRPDNCGYYSDSIPILVAEYKF